MAFADRHGRSGFPARFLPLAEFEFYPATRRLDFDAGFAVHTRSKEQPANH